MKTTNTLKLLFFILIQFAFITLNAQDTDGDSIPDSVESGGNPTADFDGDNIPNYLDLDSDNDGILDTVEAGGNPAIPIETTTGTSDYLNIDSDGDGCPDAIEGSGGFTAADLNVYDGLSGTVDGNGIPVSANGGQTTAPEVTDAAISACNEIVAQDDDFSANTPIDSLTGGSPGNIFNNNGNGTDTVNGVDATDALVADVITITNDGGITGVFIYSDGTINIPTATAPGNYIITYGICTTALISVCDTAEITVIVGCSDSTDTDGDGLTDCEETTGVDDPQTPAVPVGTSSITDPCDPASNPAFADATNAVWQAADCDADNIPNGVESGGNPTADFDGDNIPNYLDLDSDNDGILDTVEAGGNPITPTETTLGTPDYLNTDSDGDLCPDAVEGSGVFTVADLNVNNTLSGNVDGNGVPIATGATGQATSPAVTDTAISACNTILAQDDDFSTNTPINSVTGGSPGNIFVDNGNGTDTVNGIDATDTLVDNVITITNDGGLTGILIASDGTINIPAGAAPGNYNVTYQICSTALLSVCDTAIITVNVNCPDTDNDGLTDCEETTGVDDPITTANPSGIITNPNNPDTDGDSVMDGIEANDVTDPQDSCSFLVSSVISTITSPAWNLADCDGDGVTNSNELIDVTNPLDSCDFIMASQTLTPTTICNSNTITGNIKFDYNNNGCDAADFPLSNVLVTSVDGSNVFSTFTDASGNYIQNTSSGNFTTSSSGYSSSYFATPNSQTTTFVGNGNTDNIDFCVAPTGTINDLNITIIPLNNPVPNNTVNYQIVYKNVGNTIANGTVNFNYDSAKLTYLSSSVTPTTTTSGSISYNYTNLNPYQTITIDVSFQVSSASIGDILVFSSQIDPVSGDATTYDNSIAFAQIVSVTLANRSKNNVSNANDTNDMVVIEGNEIEISNADEYLHYVIRFQNTSASEAVNMVITNELSDKLDWETIQLEKQSHNGHVLILNGSQATFNFENIYLPNSTTDEPGSHGYIAYRIKPKSSVIIGDAISNQSKIYLDSNAVITTNTVTTIIVTDTAEVSKNTIENINIYPNPSNDIIHINSPSSKIVSIEVFDTLGRLIIQNKNLNSVNISNLEKNMYLLKITDEYGNNKIKKIIKN